MTTIHPQASMASVDISPEQQAFLNQPSPYHDTFSEAHSSDNQLHPIAKTSSKGPRMPFSFLKWFRYTKMGQQQDPSDPEHEESKDEGEGEDEGEGSREPFLPFSHHKDPENNNISEESPADRWFTVLFLLLLMTGLMNLFLYFDNGPPSKLGAHSHHAHKHYQPHGSFTYKDHGQNYTCYKTHHTALVANYDYSDTYHTHDKLWIDAQGGSMGTIYTSQNRADGNVRAAGISMFHQLHCLAQIRNAIQQLQAGHRIGFSEQTDISKHRGHWPHCFDYLRQTILCNADDSLEASGVHNGQWSFSGYGSPRICRDHKWLYDVTACGEEGCEGKLYYHDRTQMEKIHEEEEKAVEEWKKEHGQKVVTRESAVSERDWEVWLRSGGAVDES